LARACFSASSYCLIFSGSFLRADGAGIALGHHLQQGTEEKRAHDEVEKEDNQGYRHSPKEQFSNLVNQI
jgi:hypothetical protein